ncbi:MAG TPA: choice-of-anchor tandem repeat GloVer-containing protein [Candidatus Dormibacteraeota bacterium]|nr:choice-of-anchor tandem repeat GloVer-containing protein [Candidatus Dormibacteraeota bacterium]
MQSPPTLRAVLALTVLTFGLALQLQAQTFTDLVNIQSKTGADPAAALIQGLDGNFYGTAVNNGLYDGGSAFRLTQQGKLGAFYSFCQVGNCTPAGFAPFAGLVQSSNGTFYGTTLEGGANSDGTVFKLAPNGTITTLHNFSGTDGASPQSGLLLASDGNFYGTTQSGGTFNFGTVFKITPGGTFTSLHSFNETDGKSPIGGMVQAANGFLYGTTDIGGAIGSGTVFKITTSGALTTVHNFGDTDGSIPLGALILGSDNNIYGTTEAGGANNYGTVFNVTPSGTFTTLYNFNFGDGAYPEAGLIQANDGNYYGITTWGGSGGTCFDGCGTVFEITPAGTLTTLHDFTGPDGYQPMGSLMQSTTGTFYGTTWYGGADFGTIFSLSTGLGAFVKPQPAFGKAGASVIILGNNLTGTTSVMFNGTAATFTVVSATEINATVPPGATSGTVQVTTPTGTLKSNPIFHVVP